MLVCNKDCHKCKKYASIRVDDKGYPFDYECLKYNEYVSIQELSNTKYFIDCGAVNERQIN